MAKRQRARERERERERERDRERNNGKLVFVSAGLTKTMENTSFWKPGLAKPIWKICFLERGPYKTNVKNAF